MSEIKNYCARLLMGIFGGGSIELISLQKIEIVIKIVSEILITFFTIYCIIKYKNKKL